MNYEEKDSGSSHLKNDPVQKPKKVSIAKIILIICILSTAVFSYMLYKKVSGFLHFLTGEIDAVTAPFKYGNFTTTGPFPLPSDDDENEGNQMIQQEAPWNAESQSEAEGEEAERIEIPADENSKDNVSKTGLNENDETAYDKKTENKEPADSFNALSEEINEVMQPASKTNTEKISMKTKEQYSADDLTPFPRQLTPFELSLFKESSLASKDDNSPYEIIKDGIFAGCGRYKMEDSLGRTFITHKGKNIYKFSFFPTKYILQKDKEREIVAGAAFKTLIKQVYGEKYYEENKERLEKVRKSFAKTCSETRTWSWRVSLFENYDFGCCADGFVVFSKEAEGKKGNGLY